MVLEQSLQWAALGGTTPGHIHVRGESPPPCGAGGRGHKGLVNVPTARGRSGSPHAVWPPPHLLRLWVRTTGRGAGGTLLVHLPTLRGADRREGFITDARGHEPSTAGAAGRWPLGHILGRRARRPVCLQDIVKEGCGVLAGFTLCPHTWNRTWPLRGARSC